MFRPRQHPLSCTTERGHNPPGPLGGFSLIAVSILLTVAALIMVSLLPGREAGDNNYKVIRTVERLQKVEQAMQAFMAANDRRPCPAGGQYRESEHEFGLEADNPGACTGGTPAAPLGPDAGTGYMVAGAIPTKTLHLPDEYAYDEWGRRLTYVVDRRATQNASCSTVQNYPTNDGTGDVVIHDGNGVISDRTLYAYISHGPDGHGAWPMQGSTVANRFNVGSTDADTRDNASVNASFAASFDNVVVRKYRTATFDDIVYYRTDLKNRCCITCCLPSSQPFDVITQVQYPTEGNKLFAFRKQCGGYSPVDPAPEPFNDGDDVGIGHGTVTAISPDNEYVAVGGGDTTFQVYKRNGDEYPFLTDVSNNETAYAVASLQFSPDGNYILAGWHGGLGQRVVLFERTGDVFTELDAAGFLPVNGDGFLAATYSADGNFIFVQEQPINHAGGDGAFKLTVYQNNGATVTYLSSIMSSMNDDGTGYVLSAPQDITNATKANPGVITVAGHGLANDDFIYINQVSGMTQLNNKVFKVANVTANTLTLKRPTAWGGQNTSTWGVYTSGGKIYKLTPVGGSSGGGGWWSPSPDGRILIQTASCCPYQAALWRLDASGVPTRVTPSPFDAAERDYAFIIWLSNSVAAVFSIDLEYRAVIQINVDDTVTELLAWDTYPQWRSCWPLYSFPGGNYAINTARDEFVFKCDMDGYQFWRLDGLTLVFDQFIDADAMPPGHGDGGNSSGITFRN